MSLKYYCGTFYIALLVIFTSCLGNNESNDVTLIDAELYSFSVRNDSVPNAKKAVFFIDQANSLIYNRDSLPYGTSLEEKLVISYSGGSSLSGVYSGLGAVLNITNLADGDSAWVISGDSLDFRKPLRLKTYALDGLTTKIYTVTLNVHQVDPDSIPYSSIATNVSCLNYPETNTILLNNSFYTYSKTASGVELQTSTNGKDWQAQNLTGLPDNIILKSINYFDSGYFDYYANTADGDWYGSQDGIKWDQGNYDYPIIAILGTVKSSDIQKETLSCIIKKDDKLMFAATPDLKNWIYGSEVPENFPVEEFSSVSYVYMYVERLVLVGGASLGGTTMNTVWASTNGVAWSQLSGEPLSGSLPIMKQPNVFFYDNKFYLMNGKNKDNTYNNKVYQSLDGGITWQLASEKVFLPANYKSRYGSSVVIDANNTLFLFGGKDNNVIPDVWQGRMNKYN